ncbi:MAG TPA: NAD(P)-dependent oxidoreductase [Acidimicrobiales bacterium]|nr:NAD(P)-dependent oxidoreductase [Acidimicrobiales bacterium]
MPLLRESRPVVVTGAAGFVGSHLVRALARSGRPVVAVDLAPALGGGVLDGLGTTAVTYRRGDLRQPGCIEEALTAAGQEGDAVDLAHLAALTRFHGEVSPTPDQALEALAVNGEATWRLCRVFHDRSAGRLLVVGTRSVFGRRPPTTIPLAEDSSYAPAGFYGSSKAAGEVGALAFGEEYGMDLTLARITGVYGPWQPHRTPVSTMVTDVCEGRPHHRPEGGDQQFEFTYVKDIVAGLVALLNAEALGHAVYHLSSGRMSPLSEVADAVRAARPTADVDLGGGFPEGAWLRSPLDVSRIAADVGFAAHWSLTDGIADYLDAMESGGYGAEAVDAGPVSA